MESWWWITGRSWIFYTLRTADSTSLSSSGIRQNRTWLRAGAESRSLEHDAYKRCARSASFPVRNASTQCQLLFPTNEQVGLANRGHRFVLVSAEVAQTACLPKFCHENVIAHRIRELQNHFTSRISMSFLLLDVTGDKHYGVSEELS